MTFTNRNFTSTDFTAQKQQISEEGLFPLTLFSSPFIEERLYLENFKNVFVVSFSALLSWSNIDQNNGLD